MEQPLKAVIVDDEPLARQLILEYLEDFPRVQVIAECEQGGEAVRVINRRQPDLVFLDIQMPGLTGFEVLARLDYLPHIIFSTAHDEFALQAFEVNAVDYLLKPYDRERFSTAVERVLQQTRRDDLDHIASLLVQTQKPSAPTGQLFVRHGARIVRVDTADILWIEAAGDYSKIHTSARIYLCGMGLGVLAKKLDPECFLRVHRSAIVAVAALAQLESDGEGGFIATLNNDARVKVSRSHADELRRLIV